jgi:hydroxymethylpyrimidine pyrophosphatase-like HAD family hydrolase
VSLKSRASLSNAALVRENYLKSFSDSYNAVAIDYDGTLISLKNRGAYPSSALLEPLKACLERGIHLVVLTGRGRSLLDLRHVFRKPEKGEIFYAMYNGSEMLRGSSRKYVVRKSIHLTSTFRSLKRNPAFGNLVTKWSLKRASIQLFPRKRHKRMMDSLCKLTTSLLPSGLVARNSGFSVDVYPKSATKDHCLGLVNNLCGGSLRFLRIGDQGHEYGNDYEMLSSKGGFSVGTLSSNPKACFPVLNETGSRILGPSGVAYLLSEVFVNV